MKVLHRDLKEGKVKLRPESLDDLWYLKGIISEGDLISGRSYRRLKDDEKKRADKGVRVPISIDIRAESVDFARYIMRLRVTGKIEGGPEDLISMGSFHTIEVKPGDQLTITKGVWKGWELDKIKEAEKAGKTPLVFVVCVEDGEAELAIIRRYGVDYISRISVNVSGKREKKEHEKTMKEFLEEAAKKVEEVSRTEDVQTILLCGPGFVKEHLYSFIKEKYPALAKRCHVEGTGTGGKVGIQEILKKGVVGRIVADSRVSYETELVEKLLEEISKDGGLSSYGINEVKNAIKYGAVEKLLISDEFLRKYGDADAIIGSVKGKKGEIAIISVEHEAGEKLQKIGGVAALLRFPLG